MARLVKAFGVLLAVYAVALAGDWLSYGGDPQGSGWQRHGKTLTVANVRDLKLLWKQQLDDRPAAPVLTSTPVIIGPTITHRGVRELVFIAGPHDNLYAFDADLGTLFWKRHFDVQSKPACGSEVPPTPVIEPDPDEDDRDDDEPGAMRPLYAVASDGRLHAIRVSDGADINAPVNFLPPNANYSSLNFWSGKVYAITWGGCNDAPEGLWSTDVRRPGAKPHFHSGKGGRRIVIGPTGAVYSMVAGAFASTEFSYKGRKLLVAENDDRFVLLDAGDLRVAAEYHEPHTRYNGTTSWQDAEGARWIYAATSKNVVAFKLSGPSSGPKLDLAWTYDGPNAGQPAVTNGLIFLLTGPDVADRGSTTLVALNAATGKQLYSSGSVAYAYAPSLALANGHICFGDSRGILYCFGIPLER